MDKLEVLDYIKKFEVINLSTVNQKGFPECRAMVNILNADMAPHLTEYFNKNNKIYMMTNTSSSKIAQIEANHKASIYVSDDKDFEGLLVLGDLFEIMDEKIKQELWHDSWIAHYYGGRHGEDYSIVEFIPLEYKHYKDNAVVKGIL